MKLGKETHPAGKHVWEKSLNKLGGVNRFSYIINTPQVKTDFIINFNEKKSRVETFSYRDGYRTLIEGACS